MILYCCPDSKLRSAGLRTLYRHVAHLVKHGFPAAILHGSSGFRAADTVEAPLRYASDPGGFKPGDIVVIPEGLTDLMSRVKDLPVRKFAICQNWSYVYRALPADMDWRAFGIERVLTYPELTAEYLAWAMGLPVHVFEWGIRDDLFYFRPQEKAAQIAYIKRKQHNVDVFQRLLRSRNPDYIRRIRWLALDELSEEDYAREIRRSLVFLSLSTMEGLYAPYLEAMRSGTIVAGYGAVGARGLLVAEGPAQNCISAENDDYFALAMRLEGVLEGMLRGDLSDWAHVVRNALEVSSRHSLEREEQSIVSIWREILRAAPAAAG
jgi:hypothetical protein